MFRIGSLSFSVLVCLLGGMLFLVGGVLEGKDDKKDIDVGGGGKGIGGILVEGGFMGLVYGWISCGGGINVDVN